MLRKRPLPFCLLGLVCLLGAGCAKTTLENPNPKPAPPPAAEVGNEGTCVVDADCVPATCCHATSCVPAAEQPDCKDIMCTADCQPNTMDCGGRCTCEAGSCKAVLAKAGE
jgi:hypothetical protein